MASNVWGDRDFQYNTITYGFDVRSGMPIDRRFVLTAEQMELLSKHPYDIMMPQNYFCVMKHAGATKVYVYRSDNAPETKYPGGDESKFPVSVGKFRLYNEGNPIVVPEDEYGNPEKLLEPNPDTGNIELPFANGDDYGLVKLNEMVEIDQSGKIKPHNFYIVDYSEPIPVPLDDRDQENWPMYRNPHTIYYLTKDDPVNHDYISGLYAWNEYTEKYVPIGGRPVDENTMVLDGNGKLSVNPKFPLIKGDAGGSESDKGVFLVVDNTALDVIDEGLTVKLAEDDDINVIVKSPDGLTLKLADSMEKDSEGKLAVRLSPGNVIEKTPQGLDLRLDPESMKKDADGELGVKITAGSVIEKTSEGLDLQVEPETLKKNDDGKLGVIDFLSDKIEVLDSEGQPIKSAVEALNRLAGSPFEVREKNTYWNHSSEAEENPLYITPNASGQDTYLHIYDYPVKDVKVKYNNGSNSEEISIINNKDLPNGNVATLELGREFNLSGADHEVTLKLDNRGSIVLNNDHALTVNVGASEGLKYIYNPDSTFLTLDLDDKKDLLGFTSEGKLDIPWIDAKPSKAQEGRILGVDSQGNAAWVDNPLYVGIDDIKVLNSDDFGGKIPFNVSGSAVVLNLSNKNGAANAFTVRVIGEDVYDFDAATNKANVRYIVEFKSNGSYAFSHLGPAGSIPKITVRDSISGNFFEIEVPTIGANDTLRFVRNLEVQGANSDNIIITVENNNPDVNGPNPGTQVGTATAWQFMDLPANYKVVGHDKKLDNTNAYKSDDFYKIGIDKYGHVVASNDRIHGAPNNPIDFSADGEITLLYDGVSNLPTDSERTLTVINKNNQNYLHVRDVDLGFTNLRRIVPDAAGGVSKADSEKINQLVDFNTLYDVITSNMGEFRGTFESEAALEARWPYGTASRNDYAFVTMATSEGTFYDRYRCVDKPGVGLNWEFEFRIAVSAFTPQQWATINSGLTAADTAGVHEHFSNFRNPHRVNAAQLIGLRSAKDIEIVPGTNSEEMIIQHSNAAITASTSEYIYPVKYDEYGHAISVGPGFDTRTKQNTLPGYDWNRGAFSEGVTNMLLRVNDYGNPEWIDIKINGHSLADGDGDFMPTALGLQTTINENYHLNPSYIEGLATVATTGNYNDLLNLPTVPSVPTNVSAFVNDAGYITTHQSLANYATISYVDAHANDVSIHVTQTEKDLWNDKQDALTANKGITISGTTIGHTNNAITAGSIVGKTSDTAGRIASITYDAYGHLTAVSSDVAYIPFTPGSSYQYWKSTGSGAEWQTPTSTWNNTSTDVNTSVLAGSNALFQHMTKNMAINYISHRNIYVGALNSVTGPIVGDICLVPVE